MKLGLIIATALSSTPALAQADLSSFMENLRQDSKFPRTLQLVGTSSGDSAKCKVTMSVRSAGEGIGFAVNIKELPDGASQNLWVNENSKLEMASALGDSVNAHQAPPPNKMGPYCSLDVPGTTSFAQLKQSDRVLFDKFPADAIAYRYPTSVSLNCRQIEPEGKNFPAAECSNLKPVPHTFRAHTDLAGVADDSSIEKLPNVKSLQKTRH